MTRRKPEGGRHCWHALDDNGDVIWSVTGSGPVVCCYCSRTGNRRREAVTRPAYPHGPFAMFRSMEYVVDTDDPPSLGHRPPRMSTVAELFCQECGEMPSGPRQGENHFAVRFGDWFVQPYRNDVPVRNATEVLAGPGGWALLVDTVFCPCGADNFALHVEWSDDYSVRSVKRCEIREGDGSTPV